jgi:hypothetical protein
MKEFPLIPEQKYEANLGIVHSVKTLKKASSNIICLAATGELFVLTSSELSSSS